MSSPLFWCVFALASLAAIVAKSRQEAGHHGPSAGVLALKACPAALLAAALATHPAAGSSRFLPCVLLGLVLSAIGDVVLELAFTAGIALFLFAHVMYLAAMGWSAERPAAQAVAFLPAALLCAVMLPVLTRRVPRNLLVPVAVYVTVISAMLGRATARAFVTEPDPWSQRMFVGAALFAVSDSLIATNRWLARVPAAQALILSTYSAAQALIASSAPPTTP
jgi:uncharacterized membrane protein YhhN